MIYGMKIGNNNLELEDRHPYSHSKRLGFGSPALSALIAVLLCASTGLVYAGKWIYHAQRHLE